MCVFLSKKKQSQQKKGSSRVSTFHLYYLHGKKQTHFVESSDSDIKNLVTNAVPESTKKSTKYAVIVFEGEESYEKTFRFSPMQT